MQVSKRVGIILSASIGAASAGIIAAVFILQLRERQHADEKAAIHLRDIQDVLTDCYNKIHDIDNHIPISLISSNQVSNHAAHYKTSPNHKIIAADNWMHGQG